MCIRDRIVRGFKFFLILLSHVSYTLYIFVVANDAFPDIVFAGEIILCVIGVIFFVSLFGYATNGLYYFLHSLCSSEQKKTRSTLLYVIIHLLWFIQIVYLIFTDAFKIKDDYMTEWGICLVITVFVDLFVIDIAITCLAFRKPHDKGFLKLVSNKGFYLKNWNSDLGVAPESDDEDE
eukprot:TRINITY_DN7186_c0_g1_i1.p1 TRINITY_DN7186_c0_g1~~TRINITY_DN7186_c0_g1_i1.p1  ORF type:complete len:198 (-),score=55.16 TRINITY_DN7186_c0_g1_i1:32-565(-)